MNTFFTSDTHFSHSNVIKYCHRPFRNAGEMNRTLIDNWNSVVGQDDTVYHLGDFAFDKPENIKRILSHLNGRKHLILGNHDKIIRRKRPEFLHSDLFHSIEDFKEISIDGIKVVLCHYGMRVWNKSHYGSIQLHGHSHGSLTPIGRSVDVGVDAPFVTGRAEYSPINWKAIKSWAEKQEIKNIDHHLERR